MDKKLYKNAEIKIGILSLSHVQNYGGKIVTYALQNKLRKLIPNADVSVIQYDVGNINEPFYKLVLERIRYQGLIKPMLHYLQGIIISKIPNEKLILMQNERNKRFDDFDDKFINFGIKTKDVNEFKEYVEALDCVVVGSDIVFRPEFIKHYSDIYFLKSITKNNVLKLAYAASIGTNEQKILLPLKDLYVKGLKNFNFLSTREKESQVFLQPLTEKVVDLCCDPVLFFDSSDFIFSSNFDRQKSNYIYMYILDENKKAIRYAKKLSKERNLDVYYFNEKEIFDKRFHNTLSDGPLEFIERVKNAKYVITNSFHCVIFSIIFKKQFINFEKTRQNMKITNLLDEYFLSQRTYTDSNYNIDQEICWDVVYEKLNKNRKHSEEYLKNALNSLYY